MKRTLIIMAIMLFTATCFASGGRPHKPDNWNILGSDDRQNRGGYAVPVPVDSDRPVSPVPEPATLLLLGVGLVGIAAWSRRK